MLQLALFTLVSEIWISDANEAFLVSGCRWWNGYFEVYESILL